VHSKRLSMKVLRASAEVATALGLAPRTEVYQLSTLRYLDRQPLSVNVSHFVPGLGERVARIDLSGRDLIDVLERELRQRVGRADVEIRAEAMPAKEAKLLQVESGVPALRVQRVIRSADGAPLHTENAVYRADIFSYKLSLSR